MTQMCYCVFVSWIHKEGRKERAKGIGEGKEIELEELLARKGASGVKVCA